MKKKEIFSIKYQIVSLLLSCILIMLLVVTCYIIPNSKQSVLDAVGNNMYDIVTLSTDLVDMKISEVGIDNITTEMLAEIIGGVGIQDVASSYVYVVNSEKLFIYHPREEKIGTEVFNETVSSVIDKINSNQSYEREKIFAYVDENGVKKYAAYCASDVSGWVTVIVGNEEDALAKINNLSKTSTILMIICSAILVAFAVLVSLSIIKPITVMTKVLGKTAELDFSNTDEMKRLLKKKDETGDMSRATASMQNSLRNIVNQIKNISDEMNVNAENLTQVTEKINSASTDNSATTEQLAASMEETSATAITIDSNMGHILENTENINKKAIDGVELSKEIEKRAVQMNETTKTALENTQNMYAEVKEKTTIALEKSKSVEKVNILATTIQEIADQTSLLSLNASIEAARAGEAGRGFAVVADEIGHLAAQSADTVKEILDIVNEVNDAVSNMESCMNMSLDYLENQVLNDYKTFGEISKQYDVDAGMLNTSMNAISDMSNSLKNSSEDIVSAVSGITDTIGEAAAGVNDVAEKTTNVVTLSSDVMSVVDNTAQNSHNLNKISQSFKL